jgi:hypothetical protein
MSCPEILMFLQTNRPPVADYSVRVMSDMKGRPVKLTKWERAKIYFPYYFTRHVRMIFQSRLNFSSKLWLAALNILWSVRILTKALPKIVLPDRIYKVWEWVFGGTKGKG